MLSLFLNLHSVGQVRMSAVGGAGPKPNHEACLLRFTEEGLRLHARGPQESGCGEYSGLWAFCNVITHRIGEGPGTEPFNPCFLP